MNQSRQIRPFAPEQLSLVSPRITRFVRFVEPGDPCGVVHDIIPLRFLLASATGFGRTPAHSRLGLEATQEYCDHGLYIRVVRKILYLQDREEELAAELGQCHTDEGTRTRPHVMRSQPPKLNLT